MTKQEKKELLFGGIAVLIAMALAILVIIKSAIEEGWSFPMITLSLAVLYGILTIPAGYLQIFREEKAKRKKRLTK